VNPWLPSPSASFRKGVEVGLKSCFTMCLSSSKEMSLVNAGILIKNGCLLHRQALFQVQNSIQNTPSLPSHSFLEQNWVVNRCPTVLFGRFISDGFLLLHDAVSPATVSLFSKVRAVQRRHVIATERHNLLTEVTDSIRTSQVN
jgi:hypothetical protein